MQPSDVHRVTRDLPWMKLPQAEFLTQHLRAHGLARCLEIGCLHGVSTCYAAAAVRDLGGHVTTLDLPSSARLQPRAEQLLDELGLSDVVTVVRHAEGASWVLMEWLQRPDPPRFDFVYLDAEHTWDATALLFYLCDRFLRPGGWLLLDDIDFAFDRSPRRNDPGVLQMSRLQRETKQVGNVWRLLVQRHPGYAEFTRRGNWGLCRKRET